MDDGHLQNDSYAVQSLLFLDEDFKIFIPNLLFHGK